MNAQVKGYTWEILPGLLGTGPLPEQFSATGHGMHREGFVVRFNGPDSWHGNFQPGMTSCHQIVAHPTGESVIVVAGGTAYVIDPASRTLIRDFGGQIETVIERTDLGIVVFGNGLWFEALGMKGNDWRTPRLSWDGMMSVQVEGDTMTGEAWSPLDDSWYPFEVDLLTGETTGGSYNGPS